MSKMLRSRKGISPILATLLLIVIAVAAVIVTYAWVMTYTTLTTTQAGEFLKVVNIDWSNTSVIKTDIVNQGTANAKIIRVYVGTSSTNLIEQTSVSYDPPTQIVSKEGGIIKITIDKSWASGTRYYFKFLTDAGNTFSYNEKPS